MNNIDDNIGDDDIDEEEEEQHYEDNTQYRDDILQTQPKTYDEWINYINNLQINVPDIPDVDFNDENEIFAHIPVIIDACKYIYNTRNYRFESYANAANELYTTYKQSYEDIQNKYAGLFNDIDNKYIDIVNKINSDITLTDDDKQQQLTALEQQKQNDINETTTNKENEVLTLNTDYMNKCYAIVQKVNEVKQQTTTETGFIGDVYIEGKLNNHPVSEYVLRSELKTDDDGNIMIDLDDYVKREELNKYSLTTHTHDEYIKKDNVNELFKQYEFYLFKMEDKLNIKFDKSTFGYSDDETVINKLFYYNKKCDTLTEQSNNIAVKLLPLVNDDQVYFIYGYLYIKNYWNSEVVYKIECKAINSNVEVNTIDIIRSNGTNWTPLEGLHKITISGKSYVGVIVKSDDAYNWNVYYSGYYNDVNLCKIVKENEYVDVSVYEVLNFVSVKEELNDKLTTNVNTINETITTVKDELNDKLTNDINTINETITSVKNEIDNKITTDIDNIHEALDTKADVGHTHEPTSFQLQNSDSTRKLNVNSDLITMSNNTNSTRLRIQPEFINLYDSSMSKSRSVNLTATGITVNDIPVSLSNHRHTFNDIEVNTTYKYSYKCNHYGSDLEEDPWFDITIIDNQYYIKLKDSYRGSSVEFEIIARGEYPVYYQCSNYGTEAEYMEYTCEEPFTKQFLNNVMYLFHVRYDLYEYEDTFTFTLSDMSKGSTDEYEYTFMRTSIDNFNKESPAIKTLIDLFYPVGSIYTSMNSTDPKYIFGGEWTQIVDKFLYCSNSSEQVGGSKQITIENLPAHGHNVSANTSSDGAHTHSISANTSAAGSHSHTYSGNTSSSGNHSHTFDGDLISGEFGQDAYIGYFEDTVVSGAFSIGTKNMPDAISASKTNRTTSRMKFSATPSGTISTTGAHTHSFKGSTSETVAHVHSINTTTRSNGSHTHSVSGITDLTGNGTDYMPPYMTVYAWYRTA